MGRRILPHKGGQRGEKFGATGRLAWGCNYFCIDWMAGAAFSRRGLPRRSVALEGAAPAVSSGTIRVARVGSIHLFTAHSPFSSPSEDSRRCNSPITVDNWLSGQSPDNGKSQWTQNRVAFNLDGQVLGIATVRFASNGTVFTQSTLVRSLWHHLVAGNNLDELRLRGGKEVPQEADLNVARPKAVPRASEERAIAATVQIRSAPGEKGFSGVVVSQDGMVATCAHHFMMPESKVVVSLPNGRDLSGEVVGVSFPSDLGLVRITEPGPFPFVEMGDSTRVHPGDACIAIGYGPLKALARQPLVRRMTILESPNGRWSNELTGDTDEWGGGDCGGGVFDFDGRLVAIFIPGSRKPEDHPRVELLRKQWNDLHVPLEQSSTSELVGVERGMQQSATAALSCTVEVLDNDTCVALGTIFAADGRILTKASLLPRHPRCRLANGRLLRAELLKTVREYDLALLQVEAADLSTVKWSNSKDVPVGTVVGLAATSSVLGFISHSDLSFPAEPGYLWASFKDSDAGPEVEKVSKMIQGPQYAKFGPQLLESGDIVLSIDGHPTRTREDVLALFRQNSQLGVIAGDVVHVVAKRNDKQLEFDIPLGPPNWPRLAGQSARCSGLSRVFSVATNATWDKYGGPVFDRDGHALGIAIAGRQAGWTLVLPAAIIEGVLAN